MFTSEVLHFSNSEQAQQEPVTRMEPRAMPPLEPVTQAWDTRAKQTLFQT